MIVAEGAVILPPAVSSEVRRVLRAADGRNERARARVRLIRGRLPYGSASWLFWHSVYLALWRLCPSRMWPWDPEDVDVADDSSR